MRDRGMAAFVDTGVFVALRKADDECARILEGFPRRFCFT